MQATVSAQPEALRPLPAAVKANIPNCLPGLVELLGDSLVAPTLDLMQSPDQLNFLRR